MLEQTDVIQRYFNEFNFFQHNNIANAGCNILDLVFPTLHNVTVTSATESLYVYAIILRLKHLCRCM